MPTLEEIKQFLESQGKGDFLEAIVTMLQESKQALQPDLSRAKNEAQKFRRFKNGFQELGFDTENGNVEEFIKSLKESKEKVSVVDETTSENSALKTSIETLRRDLQKLQGDYQESNKKATELEIKHKQAKIATLLKKALSDDTGTPKLYGQDSEIELLLMKNALDLDGERVIWRDGESTLDFDSGLKTFLEQKKSQLRNSQRPGSSGVPGGSPQGKTITRSQFEALNPGAKLSSVKEGIQVIDD